MSETQKHTKPNVPNLSGKREQKEPRVPSAERETNVGRNVPNLRFPGFEGEWERINVADLLEFFPTNSLSWDQLEYTRGSLLNLHYGLIHNGLPTQVNLNESELPSIKDDYKPKKFTLCEKGDLAFADASEDTNDVGKVIEFVDCAGKEIVCGLHTIHGRDKLHKTIPGFKGYAFSSKAFHDQIKRIAQGTKIFSISTGNFEEVSIGIPTSAEQIKLASFLSLIDKRIIIQNKVIERYESLIKALNQRHFRGVRADEKLNYVSLSDILHERREYCENDGTYPHASLSKEGVDVKTERYDRDFLVRDNEKKYKVTRLNDICYNPANLKFGVITRNKKGTLIFSPIYVTFCVSNNYDPEYIEYYLTEPDFIRKMLRFEQGTVYERMAVSPEDFLSERIRIPDKNSQTKHAHLISEVKRHLESERRLLTSWICVKSHILSEMFI